MNLSLGLIESYYWPLSHHSHCPEKDDKLTLLMFLDNKYKNTTESEVESRLIFKMKCSLGIEESIVKQKLAWVFFKISARIFVS